MQRAQPLSFGDQLQRYRIRAGLSREALAEQAGISAAAIAALERRRRQRPYPDTVRRLAEALALTAEERADFAGSSAPSTASTSASAQAVTPPSNVPLLRTPLIGREQAVAALVDLLAAHPGRLLTLTGIGGVGKTTLALAVAAALRTSFPDGVWLVELASLADPALVPHAVAQVLGVMESTGVPLLDALVSYLRSRTLLLVLDNCEHLVDACARLAERLLTSCPGVSILATSREPLQLSGERQWRVPPLGLPADTGGSPAELAAAAAVQLFEQRAQAVDAAFAVTPQNAAAVAQVCVRLAGIPLALELAAARVRVLTVAQILARLEDSLRLLTGTSRAAPTRQQTLRATLDYSYALLAEPEQVVFRRLAAFAGGCDLAAAELVCADEQGGEAAAGCVAPEAVLDLLGQLVDKSLVVVAEVGLTARYELLEPVRQYAREHLAASGDEAATGARHIGYYLALAEQAEPELIGPRQVDWLVRLEGEHDNFRAALRATLERGDGERGLRLAGALGPFWEKHGHLSEGRWWYEATLAAAGAGAVAGSVRAWALMRAAVLAHYQGDLDAAASLCTESLPLARAADDRSCAAATLGVLGSGQAARGAFARAEPLLEESLREALPLRDPWGRFALAHARLVLGISALGEDNTEWASRLLEESLAGFETLGDLRFMAVANTWLGHAVQRRGDPARAAALLAAAMEGHRAVGDRVYFLVYTLLHFAEVLDALDQPLLAARLLGAGEALREPLGAPLPIPRAARHTALVAALRAKLPAATFDAVWAAGRALTLAETLAEAIGAARQLPPLEQAVSAALEAGSADEPTLAEPAQHHPARLTEAAALSGPQGALTPREREVARLIGMGYSNRQIADRLVITVGTAGVHVEHILRKLDLRSRHQVADWAKAHGLATD